MRAIVLLVFAYLSLSASEVSWISKHENISKVCLDGRVYYYTDYRAPLTPKLEYSLSRSSHGVVTIISQTKCKEAK